MSKGSAFTAIVGIAFWLVRLSGCDAISAPSPTSNERDRQSLKEQVAAVVEADNQFAFDLYQRLRSDEGNLFFSPASISMALAMTYDGAAGNTAAEMAKVLHFGMPKAQLNEEMRALRASWNTKEKKQGFRLDVANRLWGQKGYHFLPEFLQVTRTNYGAEMGQVDFRSDLEQARQTINRWAEDHTGQKITNLIPSADALKDARLVLTNAVYFKGGWREPFDKTRTKDEDFYVSADRKIKAAMMNTQDDFRYAHVDGLQLLELPYGDRSVAMIFLLPEKVGKLSQIEETLSAANLQTWIQRLALHEVIIYLPKFKTTSQFQLSDTLKSMGMVSTFDAPTADFSGITGDRALFISAVIHKAFVDVNEEGTEAAAASTGNAVGSAGEPTEPPVFRADHPFIFLIRDNRTGAILFLGRIVDPTN
jgi:serpin B